MHGIWLIHYNYGRGYCHQKIGGTIKGHKYVYNIDTIGVIKSHRLVIDIASVTKSNTLVIDTVDVHAGNAHVCY